MPNLYLTEQGAILRKTGDRIIVQKDEDILLDIECHKIETVFIFGNVQFTTQAVKELFEHGIEMAIMTKTGKLIGQITSPTPKNIDLRIAQFTKYGDENFKLAFCRNIVKAKINNSLRFLRNFSYNHPEIDLKTELENIEAVLKNADNQPSSESFNGIEGTAARHYFSAFGKMIMNGFAFTGRKKHPATDPVNALLSLGYTMLYTEISSLLDGIGLDPYLGYYHKPEYGRASLASDLQEEFRSPITDRFTLRLINNKMFSENDFYKNPENEGVYLNRDALKKYFAAYEDFMNHEFVHPQTKEKTTFRKCFRIQLEKLASCIKGEKDYLPFSLEI